MTQREIWLQMYAICRQHGDDHVTSCKNADDAIEKTGSLSNGKPA